MKIKFAITIIAFTFFSVHMFGQNTISYTYDSAGNRTGRVPEQQVASSQGQQVTNQQALFPRPNPEFTQADQVHQYNRQIIQ